MAMTFYVEIALEVLLAATLCYCIILERRLAQVRKGQEGLGRTIGELNMAIAGAGASLRALKTAAGEAAGTLDQRLKRAQLAYRRIVGLDRLRRADRRADRTRSCRHAPLGTAGRCPASLPQHHEPARCGEIRPMSRTARKGRRSLRLLPSVVVVGAGLLVLNASGLVHDAFAQGKDAVAANAIAPAPKPGNKDYADDRDEAASAAEVDVLTSLSKRRKELDARQAQIEAQANILAATEARVDAKIAQLKNLQSQIAALVAERDAAQQKQMADLIKTYSAMKPKDAARIFDSLDEAVLLPVAAGMKSDVLAPVLAAMTAEQAQKLTVRLANKLTLPATNAAPAPVAAAPSPATPATAGTTNPAQAKAGG